MKKKPFNFVHIIGSGGTISESETGHNEAKQIVKILRIDKELSALNVKLQFTEREGKDSSQLTEKDRMAIAKQCVKKLKQRNVQGLVILHGTDTLALTAEYLALSIKNLRKPIVLTGAQIPALNKEGKENPLSDGRSNIIDSIKTACFGDFSEILVCFNHKIFPAGNIKKLHAWEEDAFAIEEGKSLAIITSKGIENHTGALHTKPRGKIKAEAISTNPKKYELKADTNFNFDNVFVADGMNPPRLYEQVFRIKGKSAKVLVLRGWGGGHVLLDNKKEKIKGWNKFLLKCKKNNVKVIMCSKPAGTVKLTAYDVGRELLDYGVHSGLDRTVGQICVRAAYLLGHFDTIHHIASSHGIKKTKDEKSYERLMHTLRMSGANLKDLGQKEVETYEKKYSCKILPMELLHDLELNLAANEASKLLNQDVDLNQEDEHKYFGYNKSKVLVTPCHF